MAFLSKRSETLFMIYSIHNDPLLNQYLRGWCAKCPWIEQARLENCHD